MYICGLRWPEVNTHRDIWRLLSWVWSLHVSDNKPDKKIFELLLVRYHLNDEIVVNVLRIQYILYTCRYYWVYPETIRLCLTFWPEKGVFSLRVANCTNSFCNVWRHCNDIRRGI